MKRKHWAVTSAVLVLLVLSIPQTATADTVVNGYHVKPHPGLTIEGDVITYNFDYYNIDEGDGFVISDDLQVYSCDIDQDGSISDNCHVA